MADAVANSRIKNSREVTFNADYKGKNGKVIYAKGTKTYIHTKLVDILKKNGAKMDVKEINFDKEVTAARKAFKESEKGKQSE